MRVTARLTLALLLLVSLLPLTAVSIRSYFLAQQALMEEALRRLESVAEAQQNGIESIVSQNLEKLARVSGGAELGLSLERFASDPRSEYQDTMNQILLNARSSIGGFEEVSVLALDGRVVASTDVARMATDHSDQDFFATGQTKSNVEIFLLDEDQEPRMRLSGPLYLQNELLGVLTIECDVDSIISLVGDYSGLGQTGETLLVERDENGDALFIAPARFDQYAAFNRIVPKDDLRSVITQALLRKEQLSTDAVDYQGDAVLAATRHIGKTDWGLVVLMDRAEAFAPVAQLRDLLLLSGLMSLIVVVFVPLYIARCITRPIANLTQVVSEISGGDLSRRAQVTSEDEIGILAQAFNQLAENLTHDITERKRVEQLLQALNGAAIAMEQALTHEEIFAAVAEELKKLGFSCKLFLTDEGRSRLFIKHWSYEAGTLKPLEKLAGLEARGFSIPIESADVYREVIRERKAVFIEDVEAVTRQLLPQRLKELAEQVVTTVGAPRSIAAPFIVEDKVIGVLSVESDDLTDGDEPAITAFAHQMGAAWGKANLLRHLQDSLEELKRTQDQLLQAQKMEALGILAGGVAHDFSNQLTAIRGYADLAMMQLDETDLLYRDMKEISRAVARAAGLTRQLLFFSRRQPMEFTLLSINETVDDLLKMLNRLIGEDIAISTDLEPDLWTVQADAGSVEQVIMNLAVNARDAMPEGGELSINTQNVLLDEKQSALPPQARPGRFVCLSVVDTGVGMDEEIMQRMFEPFFSTKEGGTGLGLSVVYGIVRQHGGWIDVESEPGHGSTFRVYLPALPLEAESQTQEVVSPEELRGSGEGILLVEDEEGVRSFAARVLRENGYLVFEARSAREALDIFDREKESIQLLLSDVVLPNGRGIQLVDELLSRKGDLRVLLSSGYTDDRSQWPIIRRRGFRFVQKPYALADLLQATKEALGAGGKVQRAVESKQGASPTPTLFGESLSRAATKGLKGLSALVVDDNATDRLVLREMLACWGLEVMEAEDGPTCLRELRRAQNSSRPFRLVLLDKMMPGMDGFDVAESIRRDPALRDLMVIMISSDGVHKQPARCQGLGIGHYIVKPIDQSELLNAIQGELAAAPEKVIPAAMGKSGLRILLAEDDSAAQLIGRRTLEKMSHRVEVASSGVEALQMLERDHFDLVFIDLEMPRMDGFETTRIIREREADSGQHIPIIAMTAYATEEDEARCLEAGMDGYIAKPVNPKELYRVIEGSQPASRNPGPAVAVDVNAALQVVGGDTDLLREAVGVFLEQDYPRQLKQLKEGLGRQDAHAVKAAAHGIKGALSSFGGHVARELACRLESMGRECDLSGAPRVLEELEAEVERFVAFFAQPEWEDVSLGAAGSAALSDRISGGSDDL